MVMARNYSWSTKWVKGMVTRITGRLSSEVQTEGGMVRRHVDQLIGRSVQKENLGHGLSQENLEQLEDRIDFENLPRDSLATSVEIGESQGSLKEQGASQTKVTMKEDVVEAPNKRMTEVEKLMEVGGIKEEINLEEGRRLRSGKLFKCDQLVLRN